MEHAGDLESRHDQLPSIEPRLALQAKRQEIYDQLGMEQVGDDIRYAIKYLSYMRLPYRGGNATGAIMDDLSEPESSNANDINRRQALHDFRRQLIAIDETEEYDELPMLKDPFGDIFQEGFEQVTTPEQDKALHIIQKLYRLSLLNPTINTIADSFIPTFIQHIVDPLPPRPHLRIVE